jgi:hypothetical protein
VTKEEWVKEVLLRNPQNAEKFNYEKSNCYGSSKKVEVYCKRCDNIFQQSTSAHLEGEGCPYCSKRKKYDLKLLIENTKKTYGDKYDVSSNKNIDGKFTEIEIKCNTCQTIFKQVIGRFLIGKYGCPVCREDERKEKQKEQYAERLIKMIEDCSRIHNNKYDYSKFVYNGKDEKSIIICPIHGEFLMSQHAHRTERHGCPECKKGNAWRSKKITI